MGEARRGIIAALHLYQHPMGEKTHAFFLESNQQVRSSSNATAKHLQTLKEFHIIVDYMTIAASTKKEHEEILQKVMTRAQEANVKFNKGKIQFKVNSVKYMGHVVTANGVKAYETKVKSITKMSSPTDKAGLQKMLGMIKYLAQYSPGDGTLTVLLRQLRHKDRVWLQQHKHDDAIKKLKEVLKNAPVLKSFDPKKQLIMQADASRHGLGACLLQDGYQITYASRALSELKINYAQIEKELLAIVFAVRKFH